MPWPPYSPDLSPIENLWALMKQNIHKRYPELQFAKLNAASLALLRRAAMEAWHALDCEVLAKLVDTMPHVEAVIAAEGWYTKY